MSNQNQIFQTNSAVRWTSVKWTTRILLFTAVFLIAVVVVAIVQNISPTLVNIETKNKFFADVINPLQKLNIPLPKKIKAKALNHFWNLRIEKILSIN